jgi:mRNA interferase RelE/StbE
MYEVFFDDEAISHLEKLPKEIRRRIFEKVMSAKEYPFHFFERLVGREDYKLRVGDYRVIADIDQNLKNIQVTFIGHRSTVYQKI